MMMLRILLPEFVNASKANQQTLLAPRQMYRWFSILAGQCETQQKLRK